MAIESNSELKVGAKILGLIPARSGSKGIPGKNTKVLGDKPLIAHTIETALRASCLDRLVVSTDDAAIAEVAVRHGAQVPWLRPSELATDQASVIDVTLHALDRLASGDGYCPDAVMLLQPTSPFRSVATLRVGATLYESYAESVLSISQAQNHPYWCKRLDEDGCLQPWDPDVLVPVTRQELPPVYCLNGVLYLSSVKILRNRRSLYSDRTRALVTPPEESLDIDTAWDWQLAECLWTLYHRRSTIRITQEVN